MKKVFLLFLIFFYLSAGAYEFKHSLLPENLPPKKIETIEYAPYTTPEFGTELLAMFGTYIINPFMFLWIFEFILDDPTPEFLAVVPAMIPERVPFINKKFTSWSILNLQLNF